MADDLGRFGIESVKRRVSRSSNKADNTSRGNIGKHVPFNRTLRTFIYICDLSQVDTKWETLNDYDQQILTVSNVTDIQAKIEDSQQAIEKAMACKRKIGLKLKEKSSGSGENHNESYSNTGKVPARTSQAKAKLPKLTLPKFRGEFINGTLSGTVFYPQFMTTQKFLKWTK